MLQIDHPDKQVLIGKPGMGKSTVGWLARAVVLGACLAAYHNSFRQPFVFDDIWIIQENPSIRRLWPPGEVLNPPGLGRPVQGRPVVNLTLAVNYAIGKYGVTGYRVFNLAVHAAVAMLLLGLVRGTLQLPALPPCYRRHATLLAAVVAALWAVHPLTTAAVTYVSQRSESLVSLLYLLTLYGCLRGAGAGGKRRWGWYSLSIAACWAGACTKEVIATAPLAVLLYDRVLLAGSFRQALRSRWPLYVGLICSWLPLGLLVYASGMRGETAGFSFGVSAWDYLSTQFAIVAHYLRLCFWPDRLILDYGTGLAEGTMAFLPQAILLFSLLAACVAAFFRRPMWALPGLLFFLILAPSSSVIPIVSQVGGEHRMYLPLAMVVVLAVLGAYELWRWLPERYETIRKLGPRWVLVPLLAVAAAGTALAWRATLRNDNYMHPSVLWRQSAEAYPDNARAWDYYGVSLKDLHDLSGAIECLTRSIAIRPKNGFIYDKGLPHSNRGACYFLMGRYEDALADFTAAIDEPPALPQWYLNRAAAFQKLGRYEEALSDLNQVVPLMSGSVGAHLDRGMCWRALGQKYEAEGRTNQARQSYESAVRDFTSALAIASDPVPLHQVRADVLLALGRDDEALQDVLQTIKLSPRDPNGYANRAVILCRRGDYQQAIRDVRTARQLGGQTRQAIIAALRQATGQEP